MQASTLPWWHGRIAASLMVTLLLVSDLMDVSTIFSLLASVWQLAHQVINLGLIVTSALMIWKSLMVVTHSESPVVVVLSGSMEPAFQRGDILFLWLGSAPFRVGEIVVFKIEGRDIPIVHRVIKVHEKYDGTTDVLTKGDNNDVDDRGLYAVTSKSRA